MKKVVFLFLLPLLLPAVANAYDAYINGFYYNFSGNEAEVTSIEPNGKANAYFGALEIPNSVTHEGKTYAVTGIGDYAFLRCTKLISVTIPKSITRIGVYAFSNCSGITSISIPNSVLSVGEFAFSGCTALTHITLPKSVTSIGDNAFAGCSELTSVTISEGLTSIGKEAFLFCPRINSIKIPITVAYIGEKAFSGCIKLRHIVVEKGNLTYDSRDKCNAIIETATNTLIVGCYKTVIPKGVKKIGKAAFCSCATIAFFRLSRPAILSTWQDWYDYIHKRDEDREYVHSNLQTIAIPEGVISIGDEAFSGCLTLTSISLPNSLTTIGEHAFEGCYSLKNVTIPKSVTSICNHAFHGCFGLTSFTIPNGVTAIGDSTFYGCTSLKSISIPKSVTSIGIDAFAGCKKLANLKIPEGVTYVSSKDNNENDSIYEAVDEIAQYPGGEAEGYKWLNGQIQYPADCLEQKVQGRVLVSLVIGKDGTIEEAKAIRSPHPSLSQEAERVFGLMPKWNPATLEGKPVRSRLIVPIMFKLAASEPDPTTNDTSPETKE